MLWKNLPTSVVTIHEEGGRRAMFRKIDDRDECELREATKTLRKLAEELKDTTDKLAKQVAILKGESSHHAR